MMFENKMLIFQMFAIKTFFYFVDLLTIFRGHQTISTKKNIIQIYALITNGFWLYFLLNQLNRTLIFKLLSKPEATQPIHERHFNVIGLCSTVNSVNKYKSIVFFVLLKLHHKTVSSLPYIITTSAEIMDAFAHFFFFVNFRFA